ncbi:MAG: ABC transporter substrate-binding protein [Acidimicrobiia bacterium]
MRRWRWLTLISLLALVAAACSPSGSGDTTTPVGTTQPQTTEPPGTDAPGTTAPTGEAVEVVWVRGADHPEGQAFIAVLEGFTAATGIEVNYTGLGDDLPTILGTRVENDDPPDVAVLPQPGLLRDLVSRDALMPVSQAVLDGLGANFAQVWTDLATVDGSTYGVYFKAGNKSLVFYDVAAVESSGITLPETWDEWVSVSQELVDGGFTPISVAGADGWTLSDWFENVYVRTAGPELYAQLTNHEIPWTDPSVKTALETMGELIGNPDFVNQGTAGALQVGFVDAIVRVFGSNEAVMIEGPGDIAGIANTEVGAVVGTDLDMFAFPSIDGSPGAVLGGGDVAVALTDNPGAMALLEYLTTPEAVESWAAAGGFTSPNQNLDLSAYPDELSAAVAEGLVNAEVFVFDLSDLVPAALGGTAGAGIWGQLQNWLENPGDVDAILTELEAEAAAAFGG